MTAIKLDAVPTTKAETTYAARTVDAVKIYGRGDTEVRLDSVTIGFETGRFTAIMGPSGSGKSTLLHCAAGLDQLTSGSAFIGETDLTTLNDRHLTLLRRDRIGFIFQAFNLIPSLTAEENITLPLTLARRHPDSEWMDALVSRLGIADRLKHLPSELSGGQQQRVAAARAMVTRPDLILADEPTGNLDSSSATQLLEVIRGAVDDYHQTVAMVTHDPRAASYADRVVFLADGRIVHEIEGPTLDAILDELRDLGGLTVFTIALKSVLSNKRRLFGTALSVLLGVAFLTGTLVFTDTIGRTFDNLFAGIYADTDTFVRKSTSVELSAGASQRGRIPQATVAEVAAVPGVADAQGLVSGYAQLVDADGKAIGRPGAPTLGMSYVGGKLSPWTLTPGSREPEPGEVVIDKGSADVGDLAVGDRITVLTQTGPHIFSLVGTARFGSVDSPGGASVAIFDLGTAQQVMLDGAAEIDAVMVGAAPGVAEQELTRRIAANLPPGQEALTGTEIIDETQADFHASFAFFNTFLLVFAGIALVVAAFTIYNTFQIVMTQRRREMALMRSVGATGRQVLLGQLLEAVIIGIGASIVGLGAGVAVAAALKSMLTLVGIDPPTGGTAFELRTPIIAISVGVLVTVGSAILPSWRASRVAPLSALRDLGDGAVGRVGRRRLVQGSIILGLGIAGFAGGLVQSEIAWVGVGGLLTFAGVFTLSPLLARGAARVLALPAVAISGVTGRLARDNAVRNPGRTARTGGALMIGVALVAAITMIAATAKDWTHDVFEAQFTGDFVVGTTAAGFGGLPPELADQLNELPEVAAATGVRIGGARDLDDGGDTSYVAIDPTTAGQVFDLGLVSGTVEGLTAEGILVDDDLARRRDLAMGDTLRFGFVDGTTRTLTVQGIYQEDDLAGPLVISQALHEQTGADQFDFSVYVTTAPEVRPAAAEAAIAAVSDRYANADLQSRSDYITSQAAEVDQIVNLMYGLLGLAIIIALFSIANSVSLSVHERTHEVGLLRAVGMTRFQTGSTIRWEAVIVAMLGTGLGTLLGLAFGWAISVTLRDDGLLAFTMPVPALAAIVVASLVGGVLAAFHPAWRAAHLNVLDAISHD